MEAGTKGAHHTVLEKLEESEHIEFGKWAEGNIIWLKEANKGKVQGSLFERYSSEAREAAVAAASTPLTKPGQEEAVQAASTTKAFETEEDPKLILLANTSNKFINLRHKGMRWTVQHCWPRLAHFASNCYHHKVRLVCQVPGYLVIIITSKGGLEQGNSLIIEMYGIIVLSLVEKLCT